jgi:hypothetical protein
VCCSAGNQRDRRFNLSLSLLASYGKFIWIYIQRSSKYQLVNINSARAANAITLEVVGDEIDKRSAICKTGILDGGLVAPASLRTMKDRIGSAASDGRKRAAQQKWKMRME